jgi:hypothetical protein
VIELGWRKKRSTDSMKWFAKLANDAWLPLTRGMHSCLTDLAISLL